MTAVDWVQWAALALTALIAIAGGLQWIMSSPGRSSGVYKNLSEAIDNLASDLNDERDLRRKAEKRVDELEIGQRNLLAQSEMEKASRQAALEVINRLQLETERQAVMLERQADQLTKEVEIRDKLITIVRSLVQQLQEAGMEPVSGADLEWLNNGATNNL